VVFVSVVEVKEKLDFVVGVGEAAQHKRSPSLSHQCHPSAIVALVAALKVLGEELVRCLWLQRKNGSKVAVAVVC
jgi:hypothetical protein